MTTSSVSSPLSQRTLVIGFGNPFRRDDGVALEIINLLRREKDLESIPVEEDGSDRLGGDLDTLMLHQLLPEYAETLGQYARVIFLDAHLGTIPEEVRIIEVEEEYDFHSLTHNVSPGTLLAMTRMTTGKKPRAWLISVKGEDFGFGEGLTEICRRRAEEAVRTIHPLLAQRRGDAE